VVDKSRFKVNSYQREIDVREEEIGRLKNQLMNKDDAIKVISVAQERFKQQTMELEEEVQRKAIMIRTMGTSIKDGEKAVDSLSLNRRAEGTALLEVEHLKADNARLVRLLKSTKEFKNFGEFIEDSGNGAHAMTETKGGFQRECTKKKSQGKTLKTKSTGELEDWIPAEAFNLAHSFRARYSQFLTESAINTLLEDLNKIWRNRERRQVARVKSETNTEVANVRRQLAMKAPYEEIVTKSKIHQLREDLKHS
jgi:hypothetical protein